MEWIIHLAVFLTAVFVVRYIISLFESRLSDIDAFLVYNVAYIIIYLAIFGFNTISIVLLILWVSGVLIYLDTQPTIKKEIR